MPLLISSISRSAGVASLCSTMAAMPPGSSRTIRPYPCGRSTRAVSTVAAAPRARVRLHQRPQCGRTQQRHVARQQHHRARAPCQVRFRLQERVPGAELRLLQCKAQAQPFPEAPALTRSDRWPTTTTVVAGGERVRRAQDVLDQGEAGGAVEHLGIRGLHPGSLAGGEDHDVCVGHHEGRAGAAQVGPTGRRVWNERANRRTRLGAPARRPRLAAAPSRRRAFRARP